MANVKFSKNHHNDLHGTCEQCNKNIAIAIIGGKNCSHAIAIKKHNIDAVTVIEIKEEPEKPKIT